MRALLSLPGLVLALILVLSLPELVLQGADHGLWGGVRWRQLAYQYGAFWIGLLRDWQPNFAGQSLTMFLSYGFLHGGAVHLAVNSLTLVSLAPPLLARLRGGRAFLLLWAVSVLGGAAGFAAFADTPRPMVGASGALFGLAGAWVALDAAEALRETAGGVAARLRACALAVLWPATILAALNLVMMWATPGGIAWQAHLGGFLAGAALAPFLPRRMPA